MIVWSRMKEEHLQRTIAPRFSVRIFEGKGGGEAFPFKCTKPTIYYFSRTFLDPGPFVEYATRTKGFQQVAASNFFAWHRFRPTALKIHVTFPVLLDSVTHARRISIRRPNLLVLLSHLAALSFQPLSLFRP